SNLEPVATSPNAKRLIRLACSRVLVPGFRPCSSLNVPLSFPDALTAPRRCVFRAYSSLVWLYSTTFVVESDHMLGLRSKARRTLLAYYFANPTARHHL